jgi:hypothetical protein
MGMRARYRSRMTDAGQERIAEPEIATTTLAEIYAQQGLYDRAVAIYRRIAERSPGDPRVAARVAELESAMERMGSAEAAAAGVAPDPAEPAARPAAPSPVTPAVAPAVPPRTTAAPPPPPVERDTAFLAWLERK